MAERVCRTREWAARAWYAYVALSLTSVILGSVMRSSEAQQYLSGSSTAELYGSTVSSAGDVNGDGFTDVIVGAPSFNSGQGRALVYLSSSAGVASTPVWITNGGGTEGFFGSSVASAGDVNGDGYGDVIVGAPNEGGRLEGAAYLFLGSPTGVASMPAWSFAGSSGLENLGRSVASAGDINGDGFGDVIVGSPGYTNGELAEGRALVFLGSASGLSSQPSWSFEANSASALFGWSVASAGDTNRDGYSDIIIGAPQEKGVRPGQGKAYVFLGGATGIANLPAWTYGTNLQAVSQFGLSAAGAGDVNGDGYSDIIVGEHGYTAGRAYVFISTSTGISQTPSWTFQGNTNGGQLGFSVASAGDLNRDGFADVVIGARGEQYCQSGGRVGGAYVFIGSSAGLSSLPTWSHFGVSDGDGFGYSVASAGDVNGDNRGDLIIGAPFVSSAGSSVGAAYVLRGQLADVLEAGAAQCPTPTPTVTPTATNSPTPTPSFTPTAASVVGLTPTPTPTDTPTITPTSSGTVAPTATPTQVFGATPKAAPQTVAPSDAFVSCIAGVSSATFTATANPGRQGCLRQRARGQKRSSKRWSLRSKFSTGEVANSCAASGQTEISSFNVQGRGKATGDFCRWRYSPRISASWQRGSVPVVTVKGINSRCAKKLKGAATRKLSVVTTPGENTATVTGEMRSPAISCRGWRAWEPFSLVVTSK
jgi:hypothetical protein